MLAEILQLTYEISNFPVVLYKKVFWKASQNSDVKQEAVIFEVSKWCT